MPKSHNPLNAYEPDQVPEPVLANSPRLDHLIRDGKLYLSLKDAIDLALENNLDLAIARYNLPIANTDILRTQAGGFFRGVNTGVVQGTPGGGVGGFGTGAPGRRCRRHDRRRGRRRRRRFGPGAVHAGRWNRCLVLRSIHQRQWGRRASDYATCQPADLRRALAAAEYRAGQCSCSRKSFATGTSINFTFSNCAADDQQPITSIFLRRSTSQFRFPVPAGIARGLRLRAELALSAHCAKQ